MKKRTGRPGLSRGWRIARNLAAVALLLTALWASCGFPLPTVEMEFRRLERQCLLPRSEIVYQTGVWSTGDVREVKDKAGVGLAVFDTFVVGITEETVCVANLGGRMRLGPIAVFPLETGAVPVPLSYVTVVSLGGQSEGLHMSGCNLLFLQVPGETSRAELDMDTVLLGGERFARSAREGICLKDGLWLFPLGDPEGGYSGDWYEGASYALRLYGADGALLLEKKGVLPAAI